MSLQFGTDGVRGIANSELTPEFVTALARAAARVLGAPGTTVAVGRDTRRSGTLILSALAAGFCAEGMNVADLGVVPTPAVAHRATSQAVLGAMISASHNPFQDNGIKFFQASGRKLDDDLEERIEAELHAILASNGHQVATSGLVTGAHVGIVETAADPISGYLNSIERILEGRQLTGLKVVLDCANGATSVVAPTIFRRLGASVSVIHAQPDGLNINDHCGSTHIESLRTAVVTTQADVGFAFDGDADRMLAVDHQGNIVDGDQLMAMMALDMRDRGQLSRDTVVVTVMTNLGFKLAMAAAGLTVVETKVGDRYVLEELEAHELSLGGEQSGHLILHDHATTGDGTLAALVVADLLIRSGRTLADHAGVMTRLPQVLKNVRGVDRSRIDDTPELADAIAAVEAEFNGTGRVLIRPSGTESLVRVMVEAPTAEHAESACDRLCEVVARTLSLA